MDKTLKANIALLLAAFFWGVTFIFQRQAMANLTPFAYGGVRFMLGALALLPLLAPRAARLMRGADNRGRLARQWAFGALMAGCPLFLATSFQQYGLVWTTAGKAGFITCLYVVLIPIMLRLSGRKILAGEWLGALMALAGLYLLSFTGLITLSFGDGLVLIGAFIWAWQVIAVGWLSPRMDSVVIAVGQAVVCGALSLAAAVALGQWPTWAAVSASWLDILWGGVCSVGFGFTLQVVGQKDAGPASAAIIMQMESVWAALAGCVVLHEVMTCRMVLGAATIFAGLLVSQLWSLKTR